MRFLKILFYGAVVLVAAGLFFKSKSDKNTVKGDGNITTEIRELGSFHSVHVKGDYEIKLVQDSESFVQIEADGNLQKLIKTEVRDGVLYVDHQDRFKSKEDLILTVSSPEFKKIAVSGAVDLSSDDEIEGESLEVEISGAGEANLKLDLKDFSARLSGAGEMELSGEADNVDVEIAGAGNLEAFDLEAENVKLQLTGAAAAEVFASESLDVSVSGAGSVEYRGNPEKITKHVSGAGSIRED